MQCSVCVCLCVIFFCFSLKTVIEIEIVAVALNVTDLRKKKNDIQAPLVVLFLLLIRFVYTKSFKAISTHWNAHIWANAFWFSICCSNPFKLNDDDF